MADWIEVQTGANGSTFINLDRVDCILPEPHGSRIVFSGMEDDYITSPESPGELIVKLTVRS